MARNQASKAVRQKLNPFGLSGRFRLMFDLPSRRYTLRHVLPFKRSWIVIAVITAIDIAVMIPAVMAYEDAIKEWQSLESLFELTSAIFLTAWVAGWSIAPLILTLLLLITLTGREVLIGRPGILQLGIGLPGLIVSTNFDSRKVTNLRLSSPDNEAGTSWRGTHLSFDYEDRKIDFGSGMTPQDLSVIKREIETATSGMAEEAAIVEPPDAVKQEDQTPVAQVASDKYIATRVTIASPSTLALIGANLFPVIGAFFLGWRLSDIMVLYWAESAIIALYNVAKMAYIVKWAAFFTGTFFLAHFSAFMAIHFLFIYGLFVEGPQQSGGGDLQEVAALFITLWPALVALVFSHGVSFVTNFIGKKEYERKTLKQQMTAPYSRIVLMHLTLIIGGFITLVLGNPVPVILLFILIKIAVDVRAHMNEH